jgi:hypothetical protein
MKSLIVSDVTTNITVNGCAEVFKLRTVITMTVVSEAARTYKVTRVEVASYLNDTFAGFDHCYLGRDKPQSVPKKSPLSIEALNKGDKYSRLNRMTQKSFSEAYRSYLLTLKGLAGRVLYFDRNSGEGMIHVDSLGTSFPVYACNLKGKRTWYAETACTYLERDQIVTIDSLAEVGSGLTALVSHDIKFDVEKWTALDQSRLAFRCNESGEATNGLFSGGES